MKGRLKFDAWLFSAKLAWHHPWIRWMSLLTGGLVIGVCLFFFWSTIPATHQHEFFVMHYNLYLGIDDVRGWEWLFLFPSVWFIVTLLDFIFAYGLYRTDAYFSLSLMTLAFTWSLPFSIALFYLSFVNL